MKINGISLACLVIDFATKSMRGWAFATIKLLIIGNIKLHRHMKWFV
jgi:hypothetical protein